MTEDSSDNLNQQAPYSFPESFIEDVKQVLENLYDFPYLQRHPLAETAPKSNGNENAGQNLRREVISAIEAHNPGDMSFHSPHARLYNLLHMHYVEAMTIQETSNELSISTRQAYRDLKRGQISIAEILWANRHQQPNPPLANRDTVVQSEVSRLNANPVTTSISILLRNAMRAVEKLAESHQVILDLQPPLTPITITTNPSVAQQVIVNLLSHAIKHAGNDRLEIDVQGKGNGGGVYLQLRFIPQDNFADPIRPNDVIMQLVDHLGWGYSQSETNGTHTIQVQFATNTPTILIIDDNEALIDLLKRYLAETGFRIVGTQQGLEGIRLAQEIQPDLVILDVMMPEMDGWEVLQRLRIQPQTENVPVIICSVFNDPELASSLGATMLIPKPINKERFLDALHEVGLL